MKDHTTKSTLRKKLVALSAVAAVSLGVTLTGCAPDDVPPPDPGDEPALPGDPMPEPQHPEQPETPDTEPEEPEGGQQD